MRRARFVRAAEDVFGRRQRDYTDVGMQAGTTFKALAALGAQLTGMRGPKTIIWITRGVPKRVIYPFGCQNVEFRGESGSYLAGQCNDSCANLRAGNKCVDYRPFLEHFSTELERSDAIFSSIEEIGVSLSTDPPGSRSDTLRQLANLTGGRKYSSGDIQKAMAQSLANSYGRYQLTYRTPQLDNKYHSIRVKCVRRGVRIQAPQSYYAYQP